MFYMLKFTTVWVVTFSIATSRIFMASNIEKTGRDFFLSTVSINVLTINIWHLALNDRITHWFIGSSLDSNNARSNIYRLEDELDPSSVNL